LKTANKSVNKLTIKADFYPLVPGIMLLMPESHNNFKKSVINIPEEKN
jgi:hypothetical protein